MPSMERKRLMMTTLSTRRSTALTWGSGSRCWHSCTPRASRRQAAAQEVASGNGLVGVVSRQADTHELSRALPPRGRADMTCVNCNRKGHAASECRQPKREKHDSVCFTCNKAGVNFSVPSVLAYFLTNATPSNLIPFHPNVINARILP